MRRFSVFHFRWRSCWLAGALFLLSAALVCAAPLKLISWNVENYNVEDRMTEDGFRKDYPKPESEKAALVAVLQAESPDIIALQEMGPPEFLAEFQARLKNAGLSYPYTALLQAADPKRHVAVLSRLPFKSAHLGTLGFTYRGGRERVLRGLLEARFTVDGHDFRVFVVHLKSRHTQEADDPDADDYRTGEATAIREMILARTTAADAYLIMGDFNDSPRSSPLKRFLKKGAHTLTERVPLTDSRGEVWTHHWATEGSYSQIDYFLASPAALPAIVPGSARIVDAPPVSQASDHRPITLMLDPQKIARQEPRL